jgi:hypothetical protein
MKSIKYFQINYQFNSFGERKHVAGAIDGSVSLSVSTVRHKCTKCVPVELERIFHTVFYNFCQNVHRDIFLMLFWFHKWGSTPLLGGYVENVFLSVDFDKTWFFFDFFRDGFFGTEFVSFEENKAIAVWSCDVKQQYFAV